jgi:hypothetical protein
MKLYVKTLVGLILILLIMLILLRHVSYENFDTNQWSSDTELLIVSSHWNEDLNWLKDVPHPIIVCGKEGEQEPAIPTNARCKTQNIGFEASSYLKFILEFYDELPRNVAFIHGHEYAIHQHRNLKEILMGEEWKTGKYFSMNFSPFKHCKDGNEDAVKLINNMSIVWDKYFEPYLNIPVPECVDCDCCAQFVLPRDLIKRYSKSTYKLWYNLITNDCIEIYNIDSKQMAVLFEYIWHLIYSD